MLPLLTLLIGVLAGRVYPVLPPSAPAAGSPLPPIVCIVTLTDTDATGHTESVTAVLEVPVLGDAAAGNVQRGRQIGPQIGPSPTP